MSDYIVIDLETTGLDAAKDEIIEIAAVRALDSQSYFHTMVKPHAPISEEITTLTGICAEDVKDAPEIEQAAAELKQFVQNSILIAHNAGFDSGFLKPYLSNDWLDTIAISRIVYPEMPSYSLESLLDYMGIANQNAHRALSDAKATALLFCSLCKTIAAFDDGLKRSLLMLSDIRTPLGRFFAAFCGNSADGFFDGGIIQRDDARLLLNELAFNASRNPQPIERKTNAAYKINVNSITEMLKDGWGKAQGFDERKEQVQMAVSVAEAINLDSFLLVEAGTGAGKSLAYLLPAAVFAYNNGKKIIISTHTLTLQDQLISKDVPLAKSLLGYDLSAVVLKGRDHYLCLNRYKELLSGHHIGDMPFLMQLAVWLASSSDGDVDALNLKYAPKRQEVNASINNCAGHFCPHYNSGCFLSEKRRQAKAADIVIVNHSLLIANAVSGAELFEDCRYLIIDEAHHLAKNAINQLTVRISQTVLLPIIRQLRMGKTGLSGGIIYKIEQQIKSFCSGGIADANVLAIISDTFSLNSSVTTVFSAMEQFFLLLEDCFKEKNPEKKLNKFYPFKIRVTNEIKLLDYWESIDEHGRVFGNACAELAQKTASLLKNIELLEESCDGIIDGKEVLRNIAIVCRDNATQLTKIFDNADPNYVVWIEFFDESSLPELCMAQYNIGGELKSLLYDNMSSIVFCSATLSLDGDFKYAKKELGLDLIEPEGLDELIVPSPFFYRDQAICLICKDLPEPTGVNEIMYIEKSGGLLVDLIGAAKGRTLVLFTSSYQLKSIYDFIAKRLRQMGINTLAQGISGGRHSILTRFKKERQACILGLNSFWEGVDIIGDSLSQVIIMKLPFESPDDPLKDARREYLEKQNRNDFYEYSLPEAVMRFKQGFGRLIRSSFDSGVFCVLDSRIWTKRYGRSFINALPGMKTLYLPAHEMKAEVHRWLDS